jgi:hypothetical protein
MVMLMMITYVHGNGNGNCDGAGDVLSDSTLTTPCRPPVTVIHLTRLDDTFQTSSQLLDDGWWMDDENMIMATKSMS